MEYRLAMSPEEENSLRPYLDAYEARLREIVDTAFHQQPCDPHYLANALILDQLTYTEYRTVMNALRASDCGTRLGLGPPPWAVVLLHEFLVDLEAGRIADLNSAFGQKASRRGGTPPRIKEALRVRDHRLLANVLIRRQKGMTLDKACISVAEDFKNYAEAHADALAPSKWVATIDEATLKRSYTDWSKSEEAQTISRIFSRNPLHHHLDPNLLYFLPGTPLADII